MSNKLVMLALLLVLLLSRLVATTYHVSTTGSDITGDGSQTLPFQSIQVGLDHASENDTVYVHSGVYFENLVWGSQNSVYLIGEDSENTVIDGNHNGSVITFDLFINFSVGQYGVVENFTLQNGNSTQGGGIFIQGGISDHISPTLTNLIITNNHASWGGGGIYVKHSDSYIANCSFLDNTSGGLGWAGFLDEFEGIVENSIFSSSGNTLTFDNSNWHTYPNFFRSVIVGPINHGSGANTAYTNCTLNDVSLTIQNHMSATLENTILWGGDSQISLGGSESSLTVSFSDIQGGEAGVNNPSGGSIAWLAGNIDSDPLFQNLMGLPQLSANSPCIDAGNPNSPNDPDGTRADMGAYYFHQEPAYAGPVWHVSTEGSDITGDGSYINPFASINQALAFVSEGDSILVQTGEYQITQPLELDVDSLVIASARGQYHTSLIGVNSNPLLDPILGQQISSQFQGFTLTNFRTIITGTDFVPEFSYCMFIDNIYNLNGLININDYGPGSVQMDHCTFVNNKDEHDIADGGIFNAEGIDFTFEYCSFSNFGGGAGIFSVYACSILFKYSIIDHGLFQIPSSSVSANYCYIRYPNQFPSPGLLTNMIDGSLGINPGFASPWEGVLRLAPSSICIDASNPSHSDPDGTVADIGAIYFDQDTTRVATRWYVDPDGDNWTGTGNIDAPLSSFMLADNFASPGDTILINGGTHTALLIPQTDSLTYGSMFILDGDTSHITETILDGAGENNPVRIYKSDISLIGITVQNGAGQNYGGGIQVSSTDGVALRHLKLLANTSAGKGGAISVTNSEDVTISDCFIQGNQAVTYGGGIYLDQVLNTVISNSIISDNTAGHGGGVFADQEAHTRFVDCEVVGNTATDESGGGIFCWLNSNLEIINTEVAYNQAVRGAGLYCTAATPQIIGSIFHNNTASNYGGAMAFHGTQSLESELINLTVVNNQAVNYGGGVVSTDPLGELAISNSILWNNTPEEIVETAGSIDVNYSDILGNWAGVGNFNLDPLHVDPLNGNFVLFSGSPCIDAGDPDLDGDGESWEIDIDDQDPDGTRMDVGALFFDQSTLSAQIAIAPLSIDFRVNSLDSLQQTQPIVITNTGELPLDVQVILASRSLIDSDGNYYPTVQLGEQEWMASNLRVSAYRDGTSIPNISDGEEWQSTSSGAYCFYEDDSVGLSRVYGALYNWHGAMSESNLAPEGWHIPTDDEWKSLELNLGMSLPEVESTGHRGVDQGAKLAGLNDLWVDGVLMNHPEFGTSGFTAVPGGARNGGNYEGFGNFAYFWSATEFDAENAWTRGIHSFDALIDRDHDPKRNGYSVRCVKDEITPGGGWANVDEQYLVLIPGQSDTLIVSLDASGMSVGEYSDTLLFISNDPENPIIQLAATLNMIISAGEYSGPIWHVTPDGSDEVGNGSLYSPFLTIQTAINSCSEGDTILVHPGYYNSSINIQNKTLSLIGSDSAAVIVNPPEFLIQASHSAHVLVKNLSIIATENPGLLLGAGCSDCENTDTLFLNLESIFVDGQHEARFLEGGHNTEIISAKSTFANLNGGSAGGSVFRLESLGKAKLMVRDSRFFSNTSIEPGTCILALDSSSVDIGRSTFHGNSSQDADGAIHASAAYVLISNSVFQGNSARRGGAIFLTNASQAEISLTTFTGNQATISNFTDGGGAIGVYSESHCMLQGVTFESNLSATDGGAIDVNEGTASLRRCVFSHNRAQNRGHAIGMDWNAEVNLEFSTVITGVEDTGAIFLTDGSFLRVSNSILWGGTGSEIVVGHSSSPSTLEIGWSSIQNGVLNQSENLNLLWGDGNLSSDPLINLVTTFSLLPESPCIDAGNPDFDADGDSWEIDPDDQDPDGTRLDMGALYFDQTDTQAPDITFEPDFIGQTVSTGDSLTLTCLATDNDILGMAILSFSSSRSHSFEMLDTLEATNGTYSYAWKVPDIISTDCRLAILVSDASGNVETDTTEAFTIIDGTRPWVNALVVPAAVNERDTLFLSWDVEDNIAVASVEVALSERPSSGYVLLETLPAGLNSYSHVLGSVVSDSASVRIVVSDSSGNIATEVSDYIRIMDDTAPTVVGLTMNPASGVGIASVVSITCVTQDNVAVDSLTLEYSTDSGQNWTLITSTTDVRGDTTHFDWTVPNIPGSCRLQVTAYDAVGLSHALSTTDFQVVIQYPTVASTPSWIWPTGNIRVNIDQKIDPIQAAAENGIRVLGAHSIGTQYEAVIDTLGFSLLAEGGFTSLDTLQIILDASKITNIYGYGLDGNGNGSFEGAPTDNDTLYIHVNAAGDFVEPYDQIDFQDFNAFVDAWFANDTRYELAPNSQEVPHISIQPDSEFNIFDLATFARMWNWLWSEQAQTVRTDGYPVMPIEYTQTGNRVEIILPQHSGKSEQIVLSYDPSEVVLDLAGGAAQKISAQALQLVNNNHEAGQLVITRQVDTLATQSMLELNLQSKTTSNYQIEFAIQTSDQDFVTAKSLVDLVAIPSEFKLHHNYPNPFNAGTNIKYDLPVNSDVRISIFDLRGRLVTELVNEHKTAGYHHVFWNGLDARGVPGGTGLYFARIQAGEYTKVIKMMVLK